MADHRLVAGHRGIGIQRHLASSGLTPASVAIAVGQQQHEQREWVAIASALAFVAFIGLRDFGWHQMAGGC